MNLQSLDWLFQGQIYSFLISCPSQKFVMESQQTCHGCLEEGPCMVIEISASSSVTMVGKLRFVRTDKTKSSFSRLNTLFILFQAMMKRLGVEIIMVEDDARFYTPNCLYSYLAMLYRAFENKLSLYLDRDQLLQGKGFLPNFENTFSIHSPQKYVEAVQLLSESSLSVWIPLLEIMKVHPAYHQEMKDWNLPTSKKNTNTLTLAFIKSLEKKKKFRESSLFFSGILQIRLNAKGEPLFRNQKILQLPIQQQLYTKYYQAIRDLYVSTQTLSRKNDV